MASFVGRASMIRTLAPRLTARRLVGSDAKGPRGPPLGYLNRVELIGNLGDNPKTTVIGDGSLYVTELRLATSEVVRADPKAGKGEWTTVPQWHSIKVYSKEALGHVNKFLKGDKVYVAGKLEKRTYGEGENKKFSVDILSRGTTSDIILLHRKTPKAPEN
eukprot:c448_g1_i1.p1 GENE.c448_g1_i1~~c448_g1_i1.p1  ORF type:complete len:178 (-),score=24.09 c448_g1_i1:68-550(-)